MAVHALEGLAQELARFAVDLADGVFQGIDRLVEVRRLGVEEALAFAAGAQLFYRSEVHRTQLADRLRDACDLPLQRRGARGALGFAAEPRFVCRGLAQLRRILLEVKARRLLLQLELAEPV